MRFLALSLLCLLSSISFAQPTLDGVEYLEFPSEAGPRVLEQLEISMREINESYVVITHSNSFTYKKSQYASQAILKAGCFAEQFSIKVKEVLTENKRENHALYQCDGQGFLIRLRRPLSSDPIKAKDFIAFTWADKLKDELEYEILISNRGINITRTQDNGVDRFEVEQLDDLGQQGVVSIELSHPQSNQLRLISGFFQNGEVIGHYHFQQEEVPGSLPIRYFGNAQSGFEYSVQNFSMFYDQDIAQILRLVVPGVLF